MTDQPDIAAITQRWQDGYATREHAAGDGAAAHTDVGTLLDHVEKLQAVADAARAVREGLELDGCDCSFVHTPFGELWDKLAALDSDDALDVPGRIAQFEAQYDMSSADFMRQWLAGELEDIYDYNYWAALVRHTALKGED